LNDDGAPSLSISDVSLNEGNSGTTTATLVVTLSAPSAQMVTVKWATANGTATAPGDYAAGNGTLTFAPGETSQSLTVAVNGDTLNEADENFFVDLSLPTVATIAKARGTAAVLNDDALPQLSIADAQVTEGNSGTTPVSVVVSLTQASAQRVSVKWATADETALAPADYIAGNGLLVFETGETSKIIVVNVNGDLLNEAGETFIVALTEATGATMSRDRARVTIVNDDDLPTVSINDVEVTEGNSGTSDAVLSITLSAASGRKVVVNFATADGTAKSETDYIAGSTVVTFEPGETMRQVAVPVVGDRLHESTETFTGVLNALVNATLGRGQGVVTILDNDTLNTAPQVRITSPEEEDSFLAGMSIGLAAVATDADGTVMKVEFFANGAPIGTSTQQPFAIAWNNLVAGSYAITAVATDDLDARGTSEPVHITVRADDGRKRVAIIQGSAHPEITKIQSYLSDTDLTSQVFRRDNILFENLRLFDLVIWDDVGAAAGGIVASEVALLKQLYDVEIPLYFVGDDLARSGAALTGAARVTWSNLLHQNPATQTTAAGGTVDFVEKLHPVSNGPFGVIGDFKLGSTFDIAGALGTGEVVLAQVNETPVVLAYDDPSILTRTVTQGMFVFVGENLNSRIQREKLFKDAVWWLLRLPPPPPFRNLSAAMDIEPSAPKAGDLIAVTMRVIHGGELEASGITMILDVPEGMEYVSATSEAGPCLLEDGVVVCQLGRLSRSESLTVSAVLRAKVAGSYRLHASVSANQAEPSTRENDVDVVFEVSP
ncbi:MAG: hypothetical protein EXS31_11100, partial [Pedosphaera sp.]|nr:hypothetical protein [Pedosphaera sp.]